MFMHLSIFDYLCLSCEIWGQNVGKSKPFSPNTNFEIRGYNWERQAFIEDVTP